MQSDQAEFDATYISSLEIVRRLGVSRTAIVQARERGKLPEPIVVSRKTGEQPHCLFWKRAVVEPILSAWQGELNVRRAARG